MPNPIRISEELLEQAEDQTKHSFRSVPKQIEFWAYIGKEVEPILTPADVAALVNGEIEITVSRKKSNPVSFDQVLTDLEKDRQSGKLSAKVVKSSIWYEESKEHPELLVRVAGNKRELGFFKNGQFELFKEKVKKAK